MKYKRGDERGPQRPTEARDRLKTLRKEAAGLMPLSALPRQASWQVREEQVNLLYRLTHDAHFLLRHGNNQEQEIARTLHNDLATQFRAIFVWIYPPEWMAAWKALEQGDIPGIEPLIDFLEADPIYPRSGYLKESLIPRLTRLPRELLPPTWIARLQSGVLKRVWTFWGREFRFSVRLARYVNDAYLRMALEKIAGEFYTGMDGEAPTRARHILRHLPPS